jgi:hypothetical protein
VNPRLYHSASLFSDVKKTPNQLGDVRSDYANGNDPSGGILYSVRTFGQDSSLVVKAGRDPVTGIGVPTTSYLTGLAPAAAGGSTGTASPTGGSTDGTADHGAPVH